MSFDHVPLRGSERKLGPGDSRVGPADPTEQLTVSVQVRRRPDGPDLPDLAELGAKHPRDRQRIDRDYVARSLGSDPADLAKVAEFAEQFGLRVEESDPARRTVRLSGTVEQMNQAFGVQLGSYQHSGGTYRGREGHLYVPRNLAGIVERVSGLTNLALARPHLRSRPRDISHLPASTIGQLYDFPAGDGAGQTIGIIELGGGYSPNDLNTYFNALGLATPTVVEVDVDGAANSYGKTQQTTSRSSSTSRRRAPSPTMPLSSSTSRRTLSKASSTRSPRPRLTGSTTPLSSPSAGAWPRTRRGLKPA